MRHGWLLGSGRDPFPWHISCDLLWWGGGADTAGLSLRSTRSAPEKPRAAQDHTDDWLPRRSHADRLSAG